MISIDKEKCIGCGSCVEDCIGRHIYIEEGSAKVRKGCIECGHCYALCPADAVRLSDMEQYDLSEILSPPTPNALDPHTLLNVIKSRRTIRKYQNRPLEKDLILQIIEAGRYTATAKNRQETHFICVQENLDEFKKMVWDYIRELVKEEIHVLPADLVAFKNMIWRIDTDPTDDFLFRNAPCLLIVASNWPLDVGLAEQNMEHMAISLDLGCMYNGYLQRMIQGNETLKEWLGVTDYSVLGCTLFGHPDVKYLKTAPRKKARITWK